MQFPYVQNAEIIKFKKVTEETNTKHRIFSDRYVIVLF